MVEVPFPIDGVEAMAAGRVAGMVLVVGAEGVVETGFCF